MDIFRDNMENTTANILLDGLHLPELIDCDILTASENFFHMDRTADFNVLICVTDGAMYVTEDGYLWTNAFNWQYLFYIGEDAASRIIHYAKENSIEVEYEPYRNSVAGTIIEITEEYILVDDSILCKNPADGITYKVLLNDLRISRYVEYGIVKVGDTVQISYEGEIDETNGNTIAGAISAFKAIISDKDVLVPE